MNSEDGKVALVTGGAKRVGRAIVEKLADSGFTVVFTYLSSEAEAKELAQRIGGQAIRADLSKPEEASEELRQQFHHDRLDVLVNSASLYVPSPLINADLELARK